MAKNVKTRICMKESSFWRAFGMGIASSMVASLILALYFGSQVQTLKEEAGLRWRDGNG